MLSSGICRWALAGALLLAGPATAGHHEGGAAICEGYGPQAPRDIDRPDGDNARAFPIAEDTTRMNLCNIHFHAPAEHRAADYDQSVDGKTGLSCDASASLPAAARAQPAENACKGVAPGDTIEVHWVYTSCDVAPGPGLGSCLSESCANPVLRVEAQVYTVVNDPQAADFSDFAYAGNLVDGYHQPRALPEDTGTPVRYLGSTTGPSFDEQKCSPLQVGWSVRPQCALLDIGSLSRWCLSNVFEESEAHGARAVVRDPRLLSPIETGPAAP